MDHPHRDEPHRHNENPFNSLPPVVVLLALAILGIEVVLQLAARGIVGGAAGVGWRIEMLNAFAFSPGLFERQWAAGIWDARSLSRLLTYSFVHMGFTHAMFAGVFVLALGKMVAETFHMAAVLLVYFGSAVVGALVYTLLLDDPRALFGGLPGAYGLVGAYTYLLFTGLGAMGMNRLRAFQLIGLLMAIQLFFGLVAGSTNAWVAEVAGFVTGFALSFVVSPGAVGRLLAQMRQR